MISTSYPIPGGDLQRAGTASRSLKEQLKKVGVDAAILRRVMIAAYEAEMNVVIHARSGTMWVALDDGRVDIEVADRGPGIPDIERALQEGFSTAPPPARALGFGAGMGLPNIRRSSDRFEILSEVGRGTRIRSTIFLKPAAAFRRGPGSVEARPARCRSCLACLKACPTQALRLRGGEPRVLEHRCIDCTACLAACPDGALGVRLPPGAGVPPFPPGSSTLLLPAAVLASLAALAGPARVRSGLRRLGVRRVRLLEEWEGALREAALRSARAGEVRRPAILPRCPAVVNLVELRFPALLDHLAPFLTPAEAAARAYALREAALVACCPAQMTALQEPGGPSPLRPLLPRQLLEALLPLVRETGAARRPAARPGEVGEDTQAAAGQAAAGVGEGAPAADGGGQNASAGVLAGGSGEEASADVLAAGGAAHVLSVLEAAEEGRLEDVALLDLTFCPLGCFGSPLLAGGAPVTRHRWRRLAGSLWPLEAPGAEDGPVREPPAEAVRRAGPAVPRAGLRLDEDMGRAIEKLSRIGRIARALPGRDCGVCGAPSCAGLAEDIVLGRARPEDCPFDNGGSAAGEPGGPAAAGPGDGRQEPTPGGQP